MSAADPGSFIGSESRVRSKEQVRSQKPSMRFAARSFRSKLFLSRAAHSIGYFLAERIP
jgi:hypothetical protein